MPKLLVALVVCLVSCQATTKPAVHFSSSPPGAAVHLDGVDSGFVTPCLLDLPEVESRQVEFVLPGYVTETRLLRDSKQKELVFWDESIGNIATWKFPLFLPSRDFFFPRKAREIDSPGRVFVRLEREAGRP